MSDHEQSEKIPHRVDGLTGAYKNLNILINGLPDLLRPITPEDGVDQDALQEVLRLVRDFLSSDVVGKTYTHAPVALRGRQPINQTFIDSVNAATGSIAAELISQENLELVGSYSDRLKRVLGEALERSKRR